MYRVTRVTLPACRLGLPDIGPLIHTSSAIRVETAIAEAVAKGAVLHTGGTRREAVITPTVLSHVDRGLSLYCDEVFAPVVITEAYDTLDDAIDAANSTPFALQAAVFTRSLDTATRCFAELRRPSPAPWPSPSSNPRRRRERDHRPPHRAER